MHILSDVKTIPDRRSLLHCRGWVSYSSSEIRLQKKKSKDGGENIDYVPRTYYTCTNALIAIAAALQQLYNRNKNRCPKASLGSRSTMYYDDAHNAVSCRIA